MACPFLNADSTLTMLLEPESFASSTITTHRKDALAIVGGETASLEEALEKVQASLRNYKTFHNNLSLISRLPTEILVLVFSFLDNTSPSWLLVTHVCSQWRQTAIRTPQLWTRPFLHSLNCATAMIARAHLIPLEIDLSSVQGSSKPWPMEHLQQVISLSVSRSRRLTLRDEGNYFVVSGSKTERMITLNDLKQTAYTLKEVFIISPSQAPGILPDDYFGHRNLHAPCLQHVTLKNWTLDWKTFVATSPTIVSLEITFDTSRCAQYGISEVIPNLLQLRRLKRLVLVNVFRGVSNSDFIWFSKSPRRIIDLPALKQLNLTTSFYACIIFLWIFAWSPSLAIRLDIRDFSTSDPDPNSSGKLRQLMNVVEETSPFSLRGLSFSNPSPERYMITFRDKETVWRHTESDNPPLRIEIPCVPNVTRIVGHPLSLSALERVSFFVDKIDVDFLETIGQLVGIRSLALSSCGNEFLSLFSRFGSKPTDPPNGQASSNDIQKPIYFPSVVALSFQNWIFKPASRPAQGKEVEFERVVSCLRRRQDQGFGLRFMKLTRCKGINPSDVERLRKLGVVVNMVS